MSKKVISLLLVMAMVLVLIPASFARADTAPKVDMEEVIGRQVRDYAASIAQADSASAAEMKLLLHAISKNGADLIMDESDSVTAALFNANLFQEAMTKSLAGMAAYMGKLGKDVLYCSGECNWYDFRHSYGMYAHETKEYVRKYRLGTVASSADIYGPGGYDKALNSNDEAFILVIGGCCIKYTMTRVEVKEDTAVYNIDVKVYDNFDFSSDYDSFADDGYDTSTTELVNLIGGLLGGILLEEFYWEANASFQIEVPYNCDHTFGGYSWELNTQENTLVNNTSDGFHKNDAKTCVYKDSSYYYQLESVVQLLHDRPWVVEYTGAGISALSLSTASTCTDAFPYFRQRGVSGYIFIGSYEVLGQDEPENPVESDTEDEDSPDHIWHYRGVKTSDFAKLSSQTNYTYRLENVIAEDGSNMVYLSIYDEDLGQTVLEATPMDDYYKRYSYESNYTLMDSEDPWLSGKDIFINYIGSRSYPLSADSLQLTIWENGENTTRGDTFTTKWKDADCTHAGGLVHKCTKCGYSYTTETINPKGHSFGKYVSNNDATCTSDGTMTAVCSTCGETDTVTDPGTVTGHLAVELPGADATCTQEGMTAGSICEYCGKLLVRPEVIPALGHRYLEANCQAPMTCTRCGESRGEIGEHHPVKLPGKKAACGIPGLTEGVACGTCGLVITAQEEIPALEHSWKNADCENPRTCTRCGSTDGKALGHTESVVPGYAATCTECGLTDGLKCAVCGKVLQKQEVIEATGHNWQNSTGVCADCGAVKGEAHEHTAQLVAGSAATCTEDGLTDGYVCSACGVVIRPQTVIEAAGHDWADADCDTPQTCRVCGQTQGEALGHDQVTDAATAPNCTRTGLTEGVHCGVCGEVLVKQQVLAAADHVDANGDGKCDACGILLETDPEPTEKPAEVPEEPTEAPSEAPTEAPSEEPTEEPTEAPSEEPTEEPTEAPSEEPTEKPTEAPTEETGTSPTFEPSQTPTEVPAGETIQSEIAIICVFVLGAIALVAAAAIFLRRKKASK